MKNSILDYSFAFIEDFPKLSVRFVSMQYVEYDSFPESARYRIDKHLT